MANSGTWKKGDLEPPWDYQLTDADGALIPLGASDQVWFLMRQINTVQPVLRTQMTVINRAPDLTLDPDAVQIRHAWSATGAGWGGGHELGAVGVFEIEHEQLVGGTRPRTHPNIGYDLVVVVEDIDYP